MKKTIDFFYFCLSATARSKTSWQIGKIREARKNPQNISVLVL
jgi:hypothetical protein